MGKHKYLLDSIQYFSKYINDERQRQKTISRPGDQDQVGALRFEIATKSLTLNMIYTVKPAITEGCDCEDCRAGKHLYFLYRLPATGKNWSAMSLQPVRQRRGM